MISKSFPVAMDYRLIRFLSTKSARRDRLTAFLAYSAIALAVYFPLAIGLNSRLLGAGDHYINLWNLWWLHEGMWRPEQSLLWTDYQHYPAGISLAAQQLNFTQSLWITPVYWLLGPVAALNAIILASFALTGFFTFLLALRLLRSAMPAFLAGLAFSLAPFHTAHALSGQVELISLQWIPLSLLATLKWLEEPSLGRASWVGVCGALLLYSSWHLALFGALLCGLLVARHCWHCPQALKEKSAWIGAALILGISLAFALPALLPFWIARGEFTTHTGHLVFCSDLLGFWVPGEASAWNGWSQGVWRSLSGHAGESANYLGYPVLLLAGLGAFCWKGQRLFWLSVTAGGALLSLGPYLHVGGQYQFEIAALGWLQPVGHLLRQLADALTDSWFVPQGQIALPMPFLALKGIPGLWLVRAPGRFMAVAYLGLALLAGAGLAALLKKVPQGKRCLLAAAAFFLVGMDYLPRVTWLELDPHPIYSQIAAQPGDFAVLDVTGLPRTLYHQSIHGKRLPTGSVGRGHRPAIEAMMESGLHDFWSQKLDAVSLEKVLQGAQRMKIRYIIVDLQRKKAWQLMQEAGLKEHFRDSRVVVFRLPLQGGATG